MQFSQNIKTLRHKQGLSQQQVADDLSITRARYAKYEEGKSEPPIDILKAISRKFGVSIDILVSVNLEKYAVEELLKLDDNRILLPVMVDAEGRDMIEVVPYKGRAGYLSGYSDPEFIEKLERMYMPFLPLGKYRTFPIDGDSMPPHKAVFYVTGRYVENLKHVKDGKTYVILSRTEGIVYKRVYRKPGENVFILHSDNPLYRPYEIRFQDVLEIWQYVCATNTEEFEPDDMNIGNVKDMLRQLQESVGEIKKNLN